MPNFLQQLKSGNYDKTKLVEVESTTLELLQNFLLEMLDDVLDVCQENGIPYILGGGTALGAVRHNGFIPWDDDIDINMFRRDFEKFIPLFEKKYGDKYWIHTLGSTNGYDLIMCHIVSKTVHMRELLDTSPEESGLTLDVFVMENTFDNNILRSLHGFYCMFYRLVLSCIRFSKASNELADLISDDPQLKKILVVRSSIGKVLLMVPEHFWEKQAKKAFELCKNHNSRYVVIPGGQFQFFKEMYTRESMLPTKTLIFEGRSTSVCEGINSYLENLYNDYMTLPPEDKREKHVLLSLDMNSLNKD